MDPLWWLIPVAMVGGFIDSIVGGGGIINLPALIAAGVPPHAAIATNKVAGTGASSVATWQYVRAGLTGRLAWVLFPLAVVGGAVGAMIVLRIPEEWVLGLVTTVVVIMVVYVLLKPEFGASEHAAPTQRRLVILAGLVFLIATYDGFLGPGTGTLLLFALVSVTGFRFLHAAAHGRVMNLGSNLGALAWFASAADLDWRLGLGMMAGTMTGAFIGSRANVRYNGAWVRPLFVVMATAISARMLWTAV